MIVIDKYINPDTTIDDIKPLGTVLEVKGNNVVTVGFKEEFYCEKLNENVVVHFTFRGEEDNYKLDRVFLNLIDEDKINVHSEIFDLLSKVHGESEDKNIYLKHVDGYTITESGDFLLDSIIIIIDKNQEYCQRFVTDNWKGQTSSDKVN